MSLHHIKTVIAAGVLIGLTGQAAWADTVTSAWSGATSTTWNTAANWAGGVPSTTVGALFNSTFTNQPNLTADQTMQGIWLATGVGQDVTINAGSARTIFFNPLATFNDLPNTDILMDDSANHNLTFGSNITLNFNGGRSATAIRVNNAGTLTIAGVIRGTGSAGVGMTGTGAGTIDVTGQLGPGGDTPFGVSNVTVILEQANPSMNVPGISVGAGGVLRLNNTGAIPTGVNCDIQSGGILQLRSDTDNDLFTGSYKSAISQATINVDRKTSGGSNNTLNIGSMTLPNGGTLNVTGGNGYNLGINALTVGNGYAATVTLNPTTANLTIGTMTAPYNSGGAGQTVSLGGTTTGNVIAGVISDPVTLPLHAMALTKSNSSTWTLNGNNTYTGATILDAGTLVINGDQTAATGVVTVKNTATLGGSGIVGGITTVNTGGTLSPGNSPGTLTFNQNLTLAGGTGAAGATAIFQAGDLVSVVGILTLNTDWNLTLLDGFQNGGSTTLFTYGTAGALDLTPDFDITGLGFTPSGPLTLTNTGSAIVLNGVSIPEPATLGLLAIGGLMMLPRRR